MFFCNHFNQKMIVSNVFELGLQIYSESLKWIGSIETFVLHRNTKVFFIRARLTIKSYDSYLFFHFFMVGVVVAFVKFGLRISFNSFFVKTEN